jgi:hypothetical protein
MWGSWSEPGSWRSQVSSCLGGVIWAPKRKILPTLNLSPKVKITVIVCDNAENVSNVYTRKSPISLTLKFPSSALEIEGNRHEQYIALEEIKVHFLISTDIWTLEFLTKGQGNLPCVWPFFNKTSISVQIYLLMINTFFKMKLCHKMSIVYFVPYKT